MMSVLISVLATLRGMARSRAALHLHLLALRHQLQVLQRSRRRRLCLRKADIVGDVRGVSLDRSPSPTVYVPYSQSAIPPGVNSMDLVLVARTAADPAMLPSALRGLTRTL